MKARRLREWVFYLLLVLLPVTACAPRFDSAQISELPVAVSQSGSSAVDMGVVLTGTQYVVRQALPNAYLNSLTFLGECRSLSQLHGEINLGFVEVRRGILRQRVLSGLVSIDTVGKTMNIRFADHSPYYPSTTILKLQEGLTFEEVAAIAQEQLTSLGIARCDVTMNRFQDRWYVLCTMLGSGPLGHRNCEFEIDSSTGQVVRPATTD